MALKHCFLGVFGGEPCGWLVGLKFRVKVILAFLKREQGFFSCLSLGVHGAKSWRLND